MCYRGVKVQRRFDGLRFHRAVGCDVDVPRLPAAIGGEHSPAVGRFVVTERQNIFGFAEGDTRESTLRYKLAGFIYPVAFQGASIRVHKHDIAGGGVGGKVRAGTHRQGCRLGLLQSLWVDDRVACIRPAAEAFTCRVEKIRARAHGILRIINIGTRVQALTQFIAAVLGIFRFSTGIREGESVQPHAVFVEVRECVITFGSEISRNIAPGDNAVFFTLLSGFERELRHRDFVGSFPLPGGVIFGAHNHVERAGALCRIHLDTRV